MKEINLTPTTTTTESICEFDDTHRVTVEVSYPNAGVDRPHSYGMGFAATAKGRKLASRFAAAVEAGAAMSGETIKTDVNGKTYVSANCAVLGRMANADLARLGF
jgi:hypothetical protein